MGFQEAADGQPGLRRPQLGAVHSVLGYWTTGRVAPVTVVMPTGTGKTETMLALLVAGTLPRLLVLVPSDVLRDQIADKFIALGVLHKYGIVAPSALRPVVGRVTTGFRDAEQALAFADSCNVIVTTPHALQACAPTARQALLAACSHLFVDEAHHVVARTWAEPREAFADRPVVQFTATPFREDGRHVEGQIVYDFPLEQAQRQQYFAPINYTSVIDLIDTDRALAQQAVRQLRRDVEAGLDHLLMVRAKSTRRVDELLPLYEELARDYAPVALYYQLSATAKKKALQAIRGRTSRIVVCVNMLGEGFDLPELKIAAVHDPQKSLGVTLQFVGRLARVVSGGRLGDASVFVARTEYHVDERLRSLYAENADWNLVLRDLSQAAVAEQREISEFEAGFTSKPAAVTLRNIEPKLSTVVYRTQSDEWTPESIPAFFGDDVMLTQPIGINPAEGVAWCVVENRSDVSWGEIKTVEELTYEMFVLYFDRRRRLLYINSSANSGLFPELAEHVAGPSERFTGSTVYRVMADIHRLIPTNIGVLDVRSQFRRFSMHVGSDVTASFPTGEAQTKTQTNISGSGYRAGERVNISASIKGRIWSHSPAPTVKHWRDWCDNVGDKLLDASISIEDITKNFIVPQDLTARPDAALLGVEWPWEHFLTVTENLRLLYDGRAYPMIDVDLRPRDQSEEGPLRFWVETAAWKVGYEADLRDGKLIYRCMEPVEIAATAGRSAPVWLSSWLNAKDGLIFLLAGDRLVRGGKLYTPGDDRTPFPVDRLRVLDWSGIDLHVESQGPQRRPDSIQARVIAQLRADDTWDVVIDDDGSGEVADVVALKIDDAGLLIHFYHCKYAGGLPGARVGDLYEVCGQAHKSVVWRRGDIVPLFKNLERRARKKQQRTTVSPFEVGDLPSLYRLQEQARVVKPRLEMTIIQPGLSASVVSDKQLDLLAATESYLRSTADAPLNVWCSG
ncbi:DEAD/DEAH box helicase [Amycolatopsis sp. H20-H5]|uniref:DEAD/DEAH box helicase n=1 Tax=Amycolatopsis sp. H20-H5 TaxID=3046309 RepID=UPI002DB7F900|nr:DEAD/DEAH box helicase family protein [Amycolatopsis sp. H20-H5]MEC3977159.1 DEAD/DEAH box helicase family protein [Amycolatopsis sp. H20-H5]